MRLSPFRWIWVLFLLPWVSSCTTPPQRDLADTLSMFEELRQQYDVPYSRMGFQKSPLIAFAKGETQIVIDEAFSEGLSDAALRYVFVHELVHLKYDDPRRGYDLLKRIHQNNAKDTKLMNNAFTTLLGVYGKDPEFKNFLDQVETRANHYASRHLIDRGENPCKAIAEIEQYTGARFRFGTEDLCK